MIDFNLFFERVYTVMVLQRVFLAYSIASDEKFAARECRAWSASARLELVAGLMTWRGGTPE